MKIVKMGENKNIYLKYLKFNAKILNLKRSFYKYYKKKKEGIK